MKRLFLGGALLGLSAIASFGATFQNVANGVYSSGLDGGGVILSGGAVDPHFVLTPPTGCVGAGLLSCSEDGVDTSNEFGPATYVVLGGNGTFPLVPGAWLLNDANSQWIGPRADQTNPSAALFASNSDFYLYRLTFDFALLGLNPATAIIRLQWASDNGGALTGSHINLNGGVIAGSGNLGHGLLSTELTISSGFISGANTLDFIVQNTVGTGGNPSGMRVLINSATADAVTPPSDVPEPATLSFLGLGLVGMGLIARRKK